MSNTNTPSPSDDLFSPDMVRLMADPDTRAKIDQRLFPLDLRTIDDMPQYLETVNTIIRNGGLQEITLHELTLIQAFIRGNNNPDEIVRIETEYNRNMIRWLHVYLEYTHSDQRNAEFQDFINSPILPEDELSEEDNSRAWNALLKRKNVLEKVEKLLKKLDQ